MHGAAEIGAACALNLNAMQQRLHSINKLTS